MTKIKQEEWEEMLDKGFISLETYLKHLGIKLWKEM